MRTNIPMTWGRTLVILTPKPLAANLKFQTFIEFQSIKKKGVLSNQVLQIAPLHMADSPHHSSDVYKHVVHNLSFFDTSSHTPNLDSKEPNLNSVKSPQF